MTSEASHSKKINETGFNKNEPPIFEQDVQEKPHDDGAENKSLSILERVAHPLSLLTNKSRLEEACTETMNERCSAVLLNELPSKEKDPKNFTIPCQVLEKHKEAEDLAADHLSRRRWELWTKFTKAYGASHINNTIPRKEKDPRSFTLPCFINNTCFDNDLVDLGAIISVMPLLTYFNLGLGELAHTKLTVELADRTVKYPKGIAENVLVGIGKFTFPVDFIILDMPEDIKVPLILERPFLSTAHAKIDVYKRKITLRVG
ncbi:hypothetical protein Tco_1191625 [Tanacetum coccineum]